jgi:AcrR family transcriptional regulator/DNA-binding MarR family transcriptional regulator
VTTALMPTRASETAGARPGRKTPAPAPAQSAGAGAPNPVSEIQRQRILLAMADVTAERGAGSVTVAHIVARSGVSRRTFYELFSDREACLLAALDQAIERAGAAVLPAYRAAPPRWREQIRAGLTALLAFFDEEPALARVCVVEALGAGPTVLARRTRVVQALIDAVDEGRGEVKKARPPRQPPPLTAEGVVGAVLAILHARLVQRPQTRFSALAPQLMAAIVHPYLGMRAAEQELHRPTPQIPTQTRPRRDPLEGLDMRLTYRTVRVLAAIGAHPGASNRQVAAAAGVADQGQVSKLLARLQNLGLIHNRGQGQPKGGANSWDLTARGHEVERSIRTDG